MELPELAIFTFWVVLKSSIILHQVSSVQLFDKYFLQNLTTYIISALFIAKKAFFYCIDF